MAPGCPPAAHGRSYGRSKAASTGGPARPLRGVPGARLASAAPPDGVALLLEGRRALLGVLGGEDRPADGALPVPLLGRRPVELALDDLLRRGHRQRAVLDDRGGELERGVQRAALGR